MENFLRKYVEFVLSKLKLQTSVAKNELLQELR